VTSNRSTAPGSIADPAQASGKPPKRLKRQAAVALSHDLGSEAAPRVVAKGYGKVAEQILELAFANNVKVREDPDLVAILSAVELDCEIPIEAFAAVAEILSYVYRENGKLRQGTDGSEPDHIEPGPAVAAPAPGTKRQP
jgi:flagellar biosynthesis protein